MDLCICGVDEVRNYLVENDDVNVVVSIGDPIVSMATQAQDSQIRRLTEKHCDSVYRFYFKDVRGKKSTAPNAPDAADVVSMLFVIKKILTRERPIKILIHCVAGISRSAAFAYMLLCTSGLSKEQTLAEIRRIRPQARPNERILRLFNQTLESSSEK